MKMGRQKKNFVIKKVPLHTFIVLLNNLYQDGADYVDLHGEIDGTGKQDNVTVSVPSEYLSPEAKALAEEQPDPPPGLEELEEQEDTPLTDEDIVNMLKHGS